MKILFNVFWYKRPLQQKLFPGQQCENRIFWKQWQFFAKEKAKILYIILEFYPDFGENEIIFFIQIINLITSYYIFILFRFFIYLAFLRRKPISNQYGYFVLISLCCDLFCWYSVLMSAFTGGVSGTLTLYFNTYNFSNVKSKANEFRCMNEC